MNQRFEGWKLALMLLVPLAIIGAAVWIGISTLNDSDDQSVSVADDTIDAGLPTATAIPETEPVEVPTEVMAPTALPIPDDTPTPLPAPTAVPTTAPTAAPAATSAPAAPAAPSSPSTPSTPSGPAPTPTPDPDVVTVSCVYGPGFPTELEIGETFGPLVAQVTPPEAASNFTYVFEFKNGKIASAIQTGLISYDTVGTYTVTLTATNSATGVTLVDTCGTVKVGEPVDDVTVSCSVSPVNPQLEFKYATPPEAMRVRIDWRPRDAKLTLQYDFGPEEDVIIVDDERSPAVSKAWTYLNEDDAFLVFWRSLDDPSLKGNLVCPAYPVPEVAGTLIPGTPTPTPTPTPLF